MGLGLSDQEGEVGDCGGEGEDEEEAGEAVILESVLGGEVGDEGFLFWGGGGGGISAHVFCFAPAGRTDGPCSSRVSGTEVSSG